LKRIVLGLHTASTLLAYCLIGLGYLFRQRTSQEETITVVLRWNVVMFAAVGSIAGLALMVKRDGRRESILLAVSTVAAFLLLILSL
jgi:hypothetical protein